MIISHSLTSHLSVDSQKADVVANNCDYDVSKRTGAIETSLD